MNELNTRHIRTYGRLRCRSIDTSIMDNNSYLHKNIPHILKNNKNLTLEIGFGNGEVLLHRAYKHYSQQHLGVEVYQNGICKVLKYLKYNPIENIYIYPIDVRDFWPLLKDQVLFQEIYLLFPDPWHKKSLIKKEKKRLANGDLINHIYDKLLPGGYFFFATDHLDYYDSVKNLLLTTGNFLMVKESINDYLNDNFVLSNYEKKATNARYYLQAIRN